MGGWRGGGLIRTCSIWGSILGSPYSWKLPYRVLSLEFKPFRCPPSYKGSGVAKCLDVMYTNSVRIYTLMIMTPPPLILYYHILSGISISRDEGICDWEVLDTVDGFLHNSGFLCCYIYWGSRNRGSCRICLPTPDAHDLPGLRVLDQHNSFSVVAYLNCNWITTSRTYISSTLTGAPEERTSKSAGPSYSPCR